MQGDSGGGITKAVQVSILMTILNCCINPMTGQGLFRKQCRHILIGIIHGKRDYDEGGPTIAVDARYVTDSVQELTGIRI